MVEGRGEDYQTAAGDVDKTAQRGPAGSGPDAVDNLMESGTTSEMTEVDSHDVGGDCKGGQIDAMCAQRDVHETSIPLRTDDGKNRLVAAGKGRC